MSKWSKPVNPPEVSTDKPHGGVVSTDLPEPDEPDEPDEPTPSKRRK